MATDLLIVLILALTVAAFARWMGLPAPLLVTGVSLLASLIPAMPSLELNGELLLALTLPPLLYSASLQVSYVSFRKSLPHIRRLGINLVVVTTVVVGLVAYLIMPEIGLATALLLGAIVGPPDAVSAAAIARKLGLPRRVMTVMSGESLINDATSLTLVSVFAAIVAGETVSVWDGLASFLLAVIVGVGVGLAFGFVLHQLRMRFPDPVVTGTAGLMLPFGAYTASESLLGSGVLAVVAMGLFVGYNSPQASYTTRQQERPLWASVDFVLESFVFAYIGLQLPETIRELTEDSGTQTLLLSVAVLVTVMLIRPIFIFVSYRTKTVFKRITPQTVQDGAIEWYVKRQPKRKPKPGLKFTTKELTVLSWSGMRGVVTLALAAALPELTKHQLPASYAEMIVVCAFIVTIGTLLIQGLTLAPLIKALGMNTTKQVQADHDQLVHVRRKSAKAGREYLQAKRDEWSAKFGEESLAQFDRFSRALQRLERDTNNRANDKEFDPSSIEADEVGASKQYDYTFHVAKEWLNVRRQVLIQERDSGNLSEEVMRTLLTAIDAEELALDTRGATRRRVTE